MLVPCVAGCTRNATNVSTHSNTRLSTQRTWWGHCPGWWWRHALRHLHSSSSSKHSSEQPTNMSSNSDMRASVLPTTGPETIFHAAQARYSSSSSSTHPPIVARRAHRRRLHVPRRRRCWRQHRLLLLLYAVVGLALRYVLRLLLRACRKQGVGPTLGCLVGAALRGQQPLSRGAVPLACGAQAAQQHRHSTCFHVAFVVTSSWMHVVGWAGPRLHWPDE